MRPLQTQRFALLLLGILLLASSGAGSVWAAYVAHPLRQTVPMGPPPTWTPAQPLPTPTPLPTRPQPPRPPTPAPQDTPEPQETPVPQDTPGPQDTPVPGETSAPPPTAVAPNTSVPGAGAPSTSMPGAPLGATPLPGDASIPQSTAAAPDATAPSTALSGTPSAGDTPVLQEPSVAQGQPWMWLSAEPVIVCPGMLVTVELQLENVGAGPLSGVTLVLPELPTLRYIGLRVTQGQVSLDGSGVIWEPGALASGEGAFLFVDAAVADDVLPDGAIPLQALLSWPAGQLASNPISLALPWAPLPDAGE